MGKSAKQAVRDSAVGGKKKKAAVGKGRAQAPQGAMSVAEKEAQLKVNLTKLKKFGIKAQEPTKLFTQWEKGFYTIDPKQLIPLRNAPFDLEACKAEPQRLKEALEKLGLGSGLGLG